MKSPGTRICKPGEWSCESTIHVLGDLLTLGTPIRVQGESFVVRSAPALGEHTEEILESLGYTGDEVEQLRTEGVV